MEIKSLNEAYEKNLIWYWCNACGDINVPGALPMTIGHPDDMPPTARRLYEKYWSEAGWPTRYVGNCEGQYGLFLCYLFDYEMCVGTVFEDIDRMADAFFEEVVMGVAKMLSRKPLFGANGDLSDCTIYVGNGTDPLGHELCIFIPEDKCEYADLLDRKIESDGLVYDVAKKSLISATSLATFVPPGAHALFSGIELGEFVWSAYTACDDNTLHVVRSPKSDPESARRDDIAPEKLVGMIMSSEH